MKFAYADPPYLGQGKKLYGKHHPDAADWDRVETHSGLVARLVEDYPDGWALSLSSTTLYTLLPLCPADARVAAWVKPFAAFKPGVGFAYTWEPVIFRGGRRITREQPTVKDHLIESITLKKGLTGAKPARFCDWILAALNAEPADTVDDLFPGTGSMKDAITRLALKAL